MNILNAASIFYHFGPFRNQQATLLFILFLILIRKIIDLKYKEEIEYDAWVEEIGNANNKIIDKFEHFYVEINRGKQVD